MVDILCFYIWGASHSNLEFKYKTFDNIPPRCTMYVQSIPLWCTHMGKYYNKECTSQMFSTLVSRLSTWFITLYILPPFQYKSYVWWNFSQTLPNELECCQRQCKCCCWWITKSNNNLHMFNNWYLDLMASTHINAVLCVRSIGVNRQWWWMGVLSSTNSRAFLA